MGVDCIGIASYKNMVGLISMERPRPVLQPRTCDGHQCPLDTTNYWQGR